MRNSILELESNIGEIENVKKMVFNIVFCTITILFHIQYNAEPTVLCQSHQET